MARQNVRGGKGDRVGGGVKSRYTSHLRPNYMKSSARVFLTITTFSYTLSTV